MRILSDGEIDRCLYCNSPDLVTTPCDEQSSHDARTDCAVCGKWHRWEKKPDSKKRRRRNGSIKLARHLDYCQMCLRGRWEVLREITAHHIIEVQDGGSDEADNLWVLCAACHSFVHHVRTYHGRNSPPEKPDE